MLLAAALGGVRGWGYQASALLPTYLRAVELVGILAGALSVHLWVSNPAAQGGTQKWSEPLTRIRCLLGACQPVHTAAAQAGSSASPCFRFSSHPPAQQVSEHSLLAPSQGDLNGHPLGHESSGSNRPHDVPTASHIGQLVRSTRRGWQPST